jgi:hypothetical protein
MAGHALVGCASAVASGGRCGPGALSAAAGSFAGPILRDLQFQHNLIAHAVVGGLASVAAGGNFANGAVTAAFGYLFNQAANLINDELAGGHTIERHVGKSIDWLRDRLSANPDLSAVSTYWNLAEANAVTQRLFDQNWEKIIIWLNDPTAGDRLIVSFTNPLTSKRYFPIGLVLEDGAPIPVPGNGARAVLDKAPNLPNGFRVTTSFPTFNAYPVKD